MMALDTVFGHDFVLFGLFDILMMQKPTFQGLKVAD